MKIVFVNITDKEKTECRKLNVNSNTSYEELLIPLSELNKRIFVESRGILNKVKAYFFDRKLNLMLKAKDTEKIYVLSKTLESAERKSALSSVKNYIQDIFSKLKYEYYTYSGSICENVDKYLAEVLEKKMLAKQDVRILLVYNNYNNIDFYLIEKLIVEYKTVDIYCTNIKGESIKEKIDKINTKYGSSVCIKSKLSKKEVKTNPYDICMYMEKSDFKLSNTAKILLFDSDSDKFDKYALLSNKYKLINNINSDHFSYMTKNYGRLKVISLLCKTILDKNLKII